MGFNISSIWHASPAHRCTGDQATGTCGGMKIERKHKIHTCERGLVASSDTRESNHHPSIGILSQTCSSWEKRVGETKRKIQDNFPCSQFNLFKF